MSRILIPCLLALSSLSAFAQTYTISRLAGGPFQFPASLTGATIPMLSPSRVAVEPSGNIVFTDSNYGAVLRLNTATGAVALVAGGKTGSAAQPDPFPQTPSSGPAGSLVLADPLGVAVDQADNIYVCDYGNYRVVEISGGAFTTLAGPTAPGAQYPIRCDGVAVDASGNVYFADSSNDVVWAVSGGAVSVFAGSGPSKEPITTGMSIGDNGPALQAVLRLAAPAGVASVAVDGSGNVYIGDAGNQRVRKVSGGTITTVAGGGTMTPGDGGPATSAQFSGQIAGVAVDPAGNLYVAENGGRIQEVSGGVINTIAGAGTMVPGDGGPAVSANLGTDLSQPFGLAADSSGSLYVASPSRIRRISAGQLSTLAGGAAATTSGSSAMVAWPASIAIDPEGNLYSAAAGFSGPGWFGLQKIANGVVTAVAGDGIEPSFIGVSPVPSSGAPATSVPIEPTGIVSDVASNIYIADRAHRQVLKFSGGTVSVAAGTGGSGNTGDGGPATSATMEDPGGIAIDSSGSIYFSDSFFHTVRKISGGIITTVAGMGGEQGYSGDGGPATAARLNQPTGVALDAAGNLFILDYGNQVVRKVSSGTISTVAGGGSPDVLYADNIPATSAYLSRPAGIALGPAGNLYIADTGWNRVQRVSGGIITTIAGNGNCCDSGDGGLATAAAIEPESLAFDSKGNLYVGSLDAFTQPAQGVIRVLTPVPLAVRGPPAEPPGAVGLPYYGTAPGATGGVPPYTWSASGLPAGMTLSSGGILGGTPSAPGISSVTFTVTDSLGATAVTNLSLEIDSATPIAGLQNAASFASGAVAPGEMIVIYGTGIGPGSLALADASSGSFPVGVAGTQVLFNGIAAPMIYSSSSQIAAIVPFEMAGLTTAEVLVTYQGKAIEAGMVSFVPAAPSIFTGGSGTGQAAALNQDNSYNNSSTPAAQGSVVTLYLTGGGQMNPGGVDGLIRTAAPFPALTQNVTATIGGQPATIAWIGQAPDLVDGVLQLNVYVPQGVTGNVPVSVAIGNVTTQAGVTIAVRQSGANWKGIGVR